MNFLVRVIVTAVALWLSDLIFTNLEIYGGDDSVGSRILVILGVALVFSLVSAIVKPIVSIISIPLLILTLGLFYLLINAFMLWLTTWITDQGWFGDWGLEVSGGFWWFVWIALILAVLQAIIGAFAPKKD
ncbi:phage holin family protein [Isoptericola sp. BMS4]|uniref:phage holin family protein n=1 Tax=Isoptericola sp. BMS4 TaxID=2527875 RepID=UPI0014238AE8|nr:phage holin family protein [Isoptericola sp. BMS4]